MMFQNLKNIIEKITTKFIQQKFVKSKKIQLNKNYSRNFIFLKLQPWFKPQKLFFS